MNNSLTEKDKECAPIALFAYNRPWHLQQTIEALLNNSEAKHSNLFIFSDGPKNNQVVGSICQVRAYIKTIVGFKNIEVIERQENYGLGKSIIEGVTFVCGKFGRVIVLEDDLVTSPYFLKFMNDGLNFYKNAESVASIHGYALPVKEKLPETYFVRGADCLGWATWQRAWELFEPDGKKLYAELLQKELISLFDLDGAYNFTQMLRDQIDGKNSSWAVRWHATIFLKNKLTLSPQKSLIKHIGNDGLGTNFGVSDMLDTEVYRCQVVIKEIPIEENLMARSAVINFFTAQKTILRRLKRRADIIIKKLFSWVS